MTRPLPVKPRVSRRFFYLVLLLLCPLAAWSVTRGLEAVPGPVVLGYRVSVLDPAAGTLHVVASVEGLTGDVFPLGIANDGPLGGGREDRFLGLEAIGEDGRELELREVAPGRWLVPSRGRPFRFEYDVSMTILDRYSSHLRDLLPTLTPTHARLIGYAYLIVPLAPVRGPVPIEFRLPEGWDLYATNRAGRNRVLVPDSEDLPNTVAALGSFRSVSADLLGIRIRLVTREGTREATRAFFERILEVCRWQALLFRSIPRREYLFVCDRNPVQGTERFDLYGLHFSSSMILLFDGSLLGDGMSPQALRIVAHEFFHNWNGEAIRPADLSMNWFTEGVTQFYAYRSLVATGYMSPAGFQAALARSYLDGYVPNPARLRHTLEEAGTEVLEGKEVTELLYDGGLLVAYALDRRIRDATGNRRSLDDVMRDLYDRCLHGETRLDEALLLANLRTVAGIDFAPAYREWVRTPGGVPAPPGLGGDRAGGNRAGDPARVR